MEEYEVWSAADLNASYEVFSKRLPDAVLLDINLGKDDGLDLLAWMHQKPETREIPVIAVTAHALVAEQERILQAGCKSVPLETNRLSTASRRTKPLPTRLENVPDKFLILLPSRSVTGVAFVTGAIRCLQRFSLSTTIR